MHKVLSGPVSLSSKSKTELVCCRCVRLWDSYSPISSPDQSHERNASRRAVDHEQYGEWKNETEVSPPYCGFHSHHQRNQQYETDWKSNCQDVPGDQCSEQSQCSQREPPTS